MNLLRAAPIALGLGALAFGWQAPGRKSLLIAGDARGSLSPCGCTKPMVGGLKRLATIVKQGSQFVAIGGLAEGAGAQDQLKVETLASAYRKLGAQKVFLSATDPRDEGQRLALSNLLGNVCEPAPSWDGEGFTVLDADFAPTATSVAGAKAAGNLVGVVTHEGRSQARQLAAKLQPNFVIYREDGRAAVERLGECWLVSPGSKLRDVVRLDNESGKLDAQIVALDERVPDDPEITALYRQYLARVDKRNLVAQIPRTPGPKFSGTAKCGECHREALKTWRHSKHAMALASLEKEGHSRDPDCVKCHVVGLSSTQGFRNRASTPQLADVGCEACHGPGAQHSSRPKSFRMAQVGAASCASCHTAEQSPGFVFANFWREILHR